MSTMAPTEIKALARIVGELDYYQLLHLERGASPREIKKAYHASSRTFHPDANRHLGDDLQGAIAQIAKRVTEAYQVLRDPRRRQGYEEMLAQRRDWASAARNLQTALTFEPDNEFFKSELADVRDKIR